MKLRIISGKFGKRLLQSSISRLTHPMSERVRGSMFSIINSELVGSEVLDVFAGTGSLGLEALSRGANYATFIERDKIASKVIAENIKSLDVNNATMLIRASASKWADENIDKSFDIIFVDPPYNDLQLSTVLKLVNLLKNNGLMVLSYPGRCEAPTVNGVVVVDNRSYGTAALAFYRKK